MSIFFTVCAASLFGAKAEVKLTIPVGRLFTHELTKETIQSDLEPLRKLYGNLRSCIFLKWNCVINNRVSLWFKLFLFVHVIQMKSITTTLLYLSANSRISQTSQSGCASSNGTQMIMAFFMAPQPPLEKVLLRWDLFLIFLPISSAHAALVIVLWHNSNLRNM